MIFVVTNNPITTKDGIAEMYDENGQLSHKGNFKEGKKEGLWEYFNEDGTSKATETYKDGDGTKID